MGGISPEVRNGDWRDLEPVSFSPILSGALEAFNESGYHGASIRDLARRVGVSVTAIYYHHPSKESMLFALLDTALSQLLAWCHEAEAEAANGQQAFENLVECVTRYNALSGLVAHLDSERRSLNPEHLKAYVAKRAEIEGMVRSALERAAEERGVAHPNPASATRAILGMTQAISTWYRPGGRVTVDALVDEYVEHARRLADCSPEWAPSADRKHSRKDRKRL